MLSKARIMAVIAIYVLVLCVSAFSQEHLLLYVGNSHGDDVSVVDLASFKVIRDIKAGDRVHGVCTEADGRRLFVTVETDDTLRIIDAASGNTTSTIKLSGRPNECAATPDGKYVAVPIRNGDSVQIVDVAQHAIVKSLPIKEPHNALNTGSDRYLYVSSMGSHEVDLIDLQKMDFSAHIPVGGRPRPYVVSPDSKTMYVAVANLHGFTIVNLEQKKVIGRVEMPSQNHALRKLEYETPDTLTHGLALTPDGRELWVSSLLDDRMYIYDVKAGKIVGHVKTGTGPNWIVFTPDGKYACVSNTDTDDVSVFNVKTRREVTRIKVGRVPKRLAVAVAPENKQAAANHQ